MDTKQLYFFIGTTAELIKLAPVIQELNRRKTPYKIVTSGQNVVRFHELKGYIGSVPVYYAFKQRPIRVRLPLVIGFIIWSVKAILNYFLFFRHELRDGNTHDTYFIVHGDTVSSLLGALIAKVFRVTLVHIESGLRSFNFLEPFPEELCRYVVSKLADIHFCPNDWCMGNLKFIRGEKINTRENTLIESFWYAIQSRSNTALIRQMKRIKKRYFVLAVHRQEHVVFNTGATEQMFAYLFRAIPRRLVCIFVVHDLSAAFVQTWKDRIRKKLLDNVVFVKTMPYIEYMHILKHAEFMVTDGGSNQEEMYYMGKPCLLLRKNTERIEGLHRNAVLSKNKKLAMGHFLENYKKYIRPVVKPTLSPSKIVCDYLLRSTRVIPR